MADYDSSLPIRTENDGDVVAKISDATVSSQQLAVEADGSINVNAAFAPGSKVRLTDGVDDSEINASGELQVRDDDANTLLGTIDADTSSIATDASTIAGDTTSIDSKLVDGNDIGDVTINNAAGAAAVNIQDGGNSITVDGSVTVSATDLDIRDLTSVSDSVEVLQDTHDDLNVNANMQVGDADVANGNPVPISDAGGSLTVDATDLDIRDLTHVSDSTKIGDGTDFLAVNSDGSINVIVSEDVPGDEIVDYNTSAAVAKDASVNHDYTVTAAKTFTGQNVWISGSGKLKVQVLVNGSVKFVGFNSTANNNIPIPLARMVKAAATQVIRITITNLDNQPQDVYSTLTGVEV